MTRPRFVAARFVFAAAAALLAMSWLAPDAAVAAETGRGTATVVDPRDNSKSVDGGGSKTFFTFRLPRGAACPGDSVTGNYRVQSFLVPASNDPGSLRYTGLGPVVEGGLPLFSDDTTSYLDEATDQAEVPGGPGTIINVPPLSFFAFVSGQVNPGRYHMGLACTLWGETKRHWSTEIDVERDSQDEPVGVSWSVVDPRSVPGGRGLALPVLVGLAVAAAAAGLVVNSMRRHRGREADAEAAGSRR